MQKNPPKHLKSDGAELWKSVVEEYGIDDAAGLALLTLACESLDRVRAAQAEILKHGELVPDRFDQLKANPACAIERDSRRDMLAALRALNLDLEPLRDRPGNPGLKAVKGSM